MIFLNYEVERILMNQQVQDYFYNLYHFSKKFKTPLTFKYLFEYGKKEKCLMMMIFMIKMRMKKTKNIIDI